MITTSVRGHLSGKEFGPQYGWSACAPSVLFFNAQIETTFKPDMEPLQRMLQTQAKNATTLVLWLDCDREGEAICDEVREVCLESNPRLHVYRAKFSTVLPGEIRNALWSLGRVNENLVQAVQARMEIDLRVGAAFTRFQTLRLQKKFDEFSSGGVISYGPCQFPTLGFVVERWARIETFVPEDFWYLEMSLKTESDGSIAGVSTGTDVQQQQPPPHTSAHNRASRPIYLKWKRDRLYDRILTMALYENCLDAQEGVVTNLTGRPKNKWRPVPLATVELQKRASRYLRIGSEVLMTAAEQLYNEGFISYPRTETEKFRPEFEHLPLIQSFQGVDGELGEYATKLLSNNNFQTPRAGPNDDKAHPPITPCKAVDPGTIPDRTKRDIYRLVVKHYLACCSRDATGKETVLTVKIASEEFKATGLMVMERNWLEIYSPWERWSTGQGELPFVQVGSRIRPTSLLMKDGRTTAPQPISEVELISLMDRNGIGTDATIATHITTIQDRSYATKNGQQKFLPTKLGIALVEAYNSMGYQLNKPELRREMEAECNEVANGRKRKQEIMQPILTKMSDCFARVNMEAHKLDHAIARHFTQIGSSDANSNVLSANFSLCGGCRNLMTLKQMQNQNQNQNQNNNGTNRVQPKVIYCGSCSLGLVLPRGVPSPMTDPQGNQPFCCPICQYQVIKISEGDGYTGREHHLCPKCFSDSPTEYGGSSTGNFRCFTCTHQMCTLAAGAKGGDIEVFPCPFCRPGTGGKIHLRRNSRGFTLSCSNYSGAAGCDFTVWLPKEAKTISIPDDNPNGEENGRDNKICNRCSSGDKIVRKVKFQWKPGSVPPHFEREYLGCVLCDQMLKSDMRITIPQVNQVRQRGRTGTGRQGRAARGRQGRAERGRGAARGRGGANRNNGGTGGTNEGITCFRCGQAGHYASGCPNNT